MKLTGNTILITGGGSGIGCGLAEALHKLGNQVIISGRRGGHLDTVITRNPGMKSVQLDVTDVKSIAAVTSRLISEYPDLNVLVNNAGVMLIDDAASHVDDEMLVSTVTTNLLGPIRMTSALIEHLKTQKSAAVINVGSVLGFVPMATASVYSATKAALHSYSMSERYRLQGSSVTVQEITPPWVQTELLNSSNEPRAMPLVAFIEETIAALGTDAEEVIVEQAKAVRNNPGPHEHAFVKRFNDMMSGIAVQ